jgi:hypothetical protein
MKEKHPFHAIFYLDQNRNRYEDPDHTTENITLFFSFIVPSSAPCGDLFGLYENPKHVDCSILKVFKWKVKVWWSLLVDVAQINKGDRGSSAVSVPREAWVWFSPWTPTHGDTALS